MSVHASHRPVRWRREAAEPVATRVLRGLVVAIIVLPWIAALWTVSPIPFGVQLLAGVLWTLCLLPAWYYLGRPRERRDPIPLLPFIGLLYGLYYPLAVLLGMDNQYYKIQVNPEVDYWAPVTLSLLGWVFLLVGYGIVRGLSTPRVPRWDLDWSPAVVQRWALLLMVVGIGMEAVRVVVGVPTIIQGLVQFLSSLGYFGIGLLTFLAMRGALQGSGRMFLVGGIAVAAVLNVGTGAMASTATLGLIVLFSIWAAKGFLNPRWVLLSLFLLVFLVSMKGVIYEFRKVAWVDTGIPVSERLDLLGRLVQNQIAAEGVMGTLSQGGEAVVQRSALTDLFADVARRTPSEIPYWGGKTYIPLIGIAIPRFIWPDKPVHRLGNEFGQRYGYLGYWDTRTSWNFPVLVEFYANFGDWGVIGGMLLVGALYALFSLLANRAGQSPLVSIAAVILSIQLINIESNFSLVFGALVMQGAALWAVLRFIEYESRSAARRERVRARAAVALPGAGTPVSR